MRAPYMTVFVARWLAWAVFVSPTAGRGRLVVAMTGLLVLPLFGGVSRAQDVQPRVERLVEVIEEGQSPALEEALVEVRRLGPSARSVVPVLVKTLRRPERRLEALTALATIGPDALPAAPAVIDLADAEASTCPACERAAVEALSGMGSAVLPAMLSATESGRTTRHNVGRWVARVAESIGRPAMPYLLAAAQDTQPRREAANAALKVVAADAASARRATRRSQAERPDPTAARVRRLTAMLRHERQRDYALRQLAHMGPEARAAVPTLVAALRDRRSRYTVLKTLGAIGPDALPAAPAVLDLLDGSRPSVSERADAADALGTMGVAALTAVSAVLHERPDDFSREGALAFFQTIVKRVGPAAVPVLEAALRDTRSRQLGAIRGFGELGPDVASAAPALASFVADDAFMRDEVEKALRSLRPR